MANNIDRLKRVLKTNSEAEYHPDFLNIKKYIHRLSQINLFFKIHVDDELSLLVLYARSIDGKKF